MHHRYNIPRFPISFLLVILIMVILFMPGTTAFASRPTVYLVLFYSPTCGHCHKVMTEDLPPLKEKYKNQLNILEVDATQQEGSILYRTAITKYRVANDRVGVPALFVGDTHLVGEQEIPENLPQIIESGLKSGGIDWPDIPGLGQYMENHNFQVEEGGPSFIDRFLQDPLANGIAVIVLLGMIASVISIVIIFLRASDSTPIPTFPEWAIPVTCILGMCVAGYLSYVEIFHRTALCGPLGDCNSVQQSPYAKLWGILPVGVLGIFGYLAILIAWLGKRFTPPEISKYASLAIWAMALLGTLFTIYLTFLEPFVIGATCAWCITNAVLITFLLWATTKPAIDAVSPLDDEEE